METIKSVNPILALVVGLVLGILLGMALFWGPFAVEWTDAHSYHLSPESKADYVALVADSFRLDPDKLQAESFLESWSAEELRDSLRAAKVKYPSRVQELDDVALVLGVIEVPPAPAAPEAQPSGLLERLRVPCMVFVIVLLVLVLGVMGFRMASKRQPRIRTAADDHETPPAEFDPVDTLSRARRTWADTEGMTLGSFSTAYRLGEDTYDESFSIETPMGEFLGECGVGISEVIGASAPDRVTAFEVWLFDKSDIRTVTKVLMSEHAFEDIPLRDRLASKGEAVLAQPGQPFVLETSGLQIRVDVRDLEYGPGEPLNGYFSKLAIELQATAKAAESDDSPFDEESTDLF